MINKDNNRKYFIDLAKGFGIISVVAFHSGFNCHLFLCLMPMFFVLSGLVFKKYDSFQIFIKRKVSSLVIPFIVFYTFLWIAAFLINYAKSGLIKLDGSSFWGDLTTGIYLNGPIWYVICIFWCNLLYYAISIIRIRFFRLVSVFLITCLGLLLCHLGISNCLDFISALFAMPFFYFGVLLKETFFFERRLPFDKYIAVYGVLFLISEFLLSLYLPNGNVSFWLATAKGNIFFYYVLRSIQIIGLLLICKQFNKVSFICFFGRNSLIILGVHCLICYLSFHRERWFGYEWYYDYIQFIICVLFSLLCIPFFKFVLIFLTNKSKIQQPL